MGVTEQESRQSDDSAGTEVHIRKVFAQNSGLCMESNLPGIKLHLGCGKHKWEGWINIDAVGEPDIRCDLKDLSDYFRETGPFLTSKADIAVAIHVLEHFYQWEAIEVVKEWYRVLKPGGQLVLELPCMDKVLRYIHTCLSHGVPLANAYSWFVFWGDPIHKDPLMVHRWGYTKQSIVELLKQVGFKEVVHEIARYHFPDRDMRVVATK